MDIYRSIFENLLASGRLGKSGVVYDPYNRLEVEGPVLAIVRNGQPVEWAEPGDPVEVILPETCFYVEAGGQVSDTGSIVSVQGAHAGRSVWMIPAGWLPASLYTPVKS